MKAPSKRYSIPELPESSHVGRAPVILLVGMLPLWEDRGDSIHLREIATSLAESGIRPVVLCLRSAVRSRVPIPEVHVPCIRTRFVFQAVLNVFGSIQALRSIWKYRVCWVYTRMEPGVFISVLAAWASRRPLIVELNGLPTEDVRLYRPHNRLLLAVSRLWESICYKRARAIVGAPGYITYIQKHFGVNTSKCVPIQLGVNMRLFYPREAVRSRVALGFDQERIVLWAGGMGPWQGLPLLIEACGKVRERVPDALFVFVGVERMSGECEERIHSLNLIRSIKLAGRIAYAEVAEYIGAARVCVATFPADRGQKGTISALKTVSYLACGRPVVTTEMDELAEPILRAGAGFGVPAEDAERFGEAVATLLLESDGSWADRCRKAYELVHEDRSWKVAAAKIAACLKRL